MINAIKNTSKKNQRIARSAAEWAYSGRPWKVARDIFEAYGRPSAAKVRAWEYCKQLCAEMDGYDLIICGWNCMKFSAYFKFFDGDKLCYAYITADYDRFCYADENDAA